MAHFSVTTWGSSSTQRIRAIGFSTPLALRGRVHSILGRCSGQSQTREKLHSAKWLDAKLCRKDATNCIGVGTDRAAEGKCRVGNSELRKFRTRQLRN